MAENRHEEYRRKILQIGESLGYRVRRSFSKHSRGDAVWIDPRSLKFSGRGLPVVAFEILTFELYREIKDCIMNLQSISPALGVLVVIEDEYAERSRKLVRYDRESYPEHIKRVAKKLSEGISLSCRIEVWGQGDVDELYSRYVEGRLRLVG